MALNSTNPTHRKSKVAKRKLQSKNDIKEPNTFATLNPGFTNFTPIKKELSRRNLSRQNAINELKDMESFQTEELLQSVQTLEESHQDLPTIEDQITEIERLTELMKRELEDYLNE